MSTSKKTITLKNDVTELGRVSQIVEEFCEESGLTPDAIYPINVVLDEVITNVISYGYDDENEHKIFVRIAMGKGLFSAEVEDDGKAYNPLEADEVDVDADVDDKRIGGLGIHFVKSLMDELEYKRENGKNILMMKKNIVVG